MTLLDAPEHSSRTYRVEIVLLAAQGMRNVEIAARLGLAIGTVGKWRNRYAACGIKGLADEPRPGAPRTVDRSEVIAATLQSPPPELGIMQWSCRRLGTYLGIGDASVARTWREYGIAPRPNGEFAFATDPELVVATVEVIGVLLSASTRIVALAESKPSVYRPVPSAQPNSNHTSLRDFIERVRFAGDGPVRLVIDGGGEDLAVRFGDVVAPDCRLVLHAVEQPGLWLNLVEVWCRLSGYSCASPQIRALAGSGRPWAWFNPDVVS